MAVTEDKFWFSVMAHGIFHNTLGTHLVTHCSRTIKKITCQHVQMTSALFLEFLISTVLFDRSLSTQRKISIMGIVGRILFIPVNEIIILLLFICFSIQI